MTLWPQRVWVSTSLITDKTIWRNQYMQLSLVSDILYLACPTSSDECAIKIRLWPHTHALLHLMTSPQGLPHHNHTHVRIYQCCVSCFFYLYMPQHYVMDLGLWVGCDKLAEINTLQLRFVGAWFEQFRGNYRLLATVLSSLPYPVSLSKVWLVTTHTY